MVAIEAGARAETRAAVRMMAGVVAMAMAASMRRVKGEKAAETSVRVGEAAARSAVANDTLDAYEVQVRNRCSEHL